MIAILKYNAGNIRSVENALNRLGVESVITNDPQQLCRADKVILPGVGEAKSAMQYLREKRLDTLIQGLEQPVLGICLGLQLLCAYSEEGRTKCLNIFPNTVRRFQGKAIVPHMGWNNMERVDGVLMSGISCQQDLYFVHSYFADLSPFTTAICDYIQPFSAALEKDNFYATQFHPEKSSAVGNQILQNFLEL